MNVCSLKPPDIASWSTLPANSNCTSREQTPVQSGAAGDRQLSADPSTRQSYNSYHWLLTYHSLLLQFRKRDRETLLCKCYVFFVCVCACVHRSPLILCECVHQRGEQNIWSCRQKRVTIHPIIRFVDEWEQHMAPATLVRRSYLKPFAMLY